MSRDEADITVISYVLEAVNCGKDVICVYLAVTPLSSSY